jgi:fatty-acyl-CoA synthase
LLRGQNVVWVGPLGYRDPELYSVFWKLLRRYRIATMSTVPTVCSVLMRCLVDADISSLQMAVVGASPPPKVVRRDFEARTSMPLVEGYGLTEVTCASARSFPDHPRPDAVGHRLPYQHMRIVATDQDGHRREMKRGEVGSIVISGPTAFTGYVTGCGSNGFTLDGLGALEDGWLDTGVLGRIGDDDFLYLTARAKNLIIRGGHNIDPALIEELMLEHPEVSGAAAVGRPDPHAGEVSEVYVRCAVTPGSAQKSSVCGQQPGQ